MYSPFSLMNGETHQTAQNLKWVNTGSFSIELTALPETDTLNSTELKLPEDPNLHLSNYYKVSNLLKSWELQALLTKDFLSPCLLHLDYIDYYKNSYKLIIFNLLGLSQKENEGVLTHPCNFLRGNCHSQVRFLKEIKKRSERERW